MSVQAVVFDIGNVLIEWQPERHYDAKFGEARRREMFEAVDLHGMNDRIDMGGPFKDTIYDEAEKYSQYRAEIRDWFDSWIKMASPEIPQSVLLLRALRAKSIPVFALSNFGVESFAYAETVYPFLGEFDKRYISGHMEVIKPDQKIYEMVEADCGVAPAGLLFADDRVDNIAAADARGWQTHLFETPKGWAKRLVDEGLLTSEEAGL
ncbi:HAD family hydrolase [Falsihalocynthiibacter sp. SS001]|uniref:HAD family hydrolase n=1 Tax=Falsihalocynthiibacter sp. SS001 TaxID=3349698 RepID=UPI0036D3EB98